MKRKSFTVLLFLLFFSFQGFSKDADNSSLPHGVSLSRYIQTVFRESGLETEEIPIVQSPGNDLPFNILLKFSGNTSETDNQLRNKLLFVVPQTEVFLNPDFYTNLLHILSADNFNFDIHFLLSFNINHDFSEYSPVSSEESFLSGIDDLQKYSVILLSSNNESTRIVSGSGGFVSPTWLVRNVYNSVNQNRLLSSFKSCYISFLYKQNLYKEPALKTFLSAGIPAVSVSINRKTDTETRTKFIADLCRNYDIKDTVLSDTHSLMFTVFHKSIWINENTNIKIIIFISFFAVMVFMLYGFLNKNLHFKAWNRIKKIWFYPVIIFILAEGVLFVYQYLVKFLNFCSINISIYTTLSFILPLIFTLNALFFFTVLKFTPNFKKRTIDFLTFITAGFNLFIFPLLDISLYPLFAAEFILAWIVTVFPQNIVHIIVLFLFQMPFLPFFMQMFANADSQLFVSLLVNNNLLWIGFFLMLIPQYLNCFRVWTGINFYWFLKKRRNPNIETNNTILLITFLVVFETSLMLVLPQKFKTTQKNISIPESSSDFISCDVEVTKYFEESMETITIKSEKDLIYCKVEIKGENTNPVLFSDHENIATDSTTTLFPLPPMPSKKLVFTFGTQENENHEIRINALFEENGFLYRKVLNIKP